MISIHRIAESILHPTLRDSNHVHHKKAMITAYISLILFLFFIVYTLYFYINYPFTYHQNINSTIGYFLFLGYFLLLRYTEKIHVPLVCMQVSSLPLMYLSIYKTGGLYSSNMIWLVLSMVSSMIIIHRKFGLILCLVHLLFVLGLYISNVQYLSQETSPFLKHILETTPAVYMFNFSFVMILLSIMLFFFILIIENLNKKIDELSKDRIRDLNIELKKATSDLATLRDNISKDFHDEMGNKLASISILSQKIAYKMEGEADSDIKESIKQIDLLSKDLYTGTKDFLWSIRWNNDGLESLFEYIREFGERFFNQININFSSNCELDFLDQIRVDPDFTRQIILVSKEIFTNSAKHSNCSEVVFRIYESMGKIIFEISDDGVGMDVDGVNNKNGLLNIQYRVKKINCDYQMHSSEGKGVLHKIILSKFTRIG